MPDPLTLLALAAPSFLPFAGASPAPPAPPPFTIESLDIQSDRYHSDDMGKTIVADGNVIISLKGRGASGPVDATIAAGSLRYDSASQVLEAQGGVSATFDGGSATGQSLRYELATRRLSLLGFSTRAYGLAFSGGSLTYSPNRMALADASFTTCEGDRPDYEVTARRIEIGSGKYIATRGVVIRLFGRRALALPNLTYRVQDGRATARSVLPLARPSYSRRSGLGFDQPVPLGPGLDGEIGYATSAGFRGLVAWEPQPSGFYALGEWKQEQPVPEETPALVSRAPEIGYRTGREGEWRFSGGYYVDHGEDTREGRMQISYRREWRPSALGGWRIALNGRASGYTSGDVYANSSIEAVYRWGTDERYTEAGIRPWAVTGKTPFAWDRIPSRLQLLAAARRPVGSLRVGVSAAYDVSRRDFHDVRVSLGRRYHCLEPEISWSSRREILLMNVRVYGLSTRSLTGEQGPSPG
jgi:hypothetical protein